MKNDIKVSFSNAVEQADIFHHARIRRQNPNFTAELIEKEKAKLGIERGPVNQQTQIEWLDQRVSVFWPEDNQWYEGTCRVYNCETGRHYVQYQDSQFEWLDFTTNLVQLAPEQKSKVYIFIIRFVLYILLLLLHHSLSSYILYISIHMCLLRRKKKPNKQ